MKFVLLGFLILFTNICFGATRTSAQSGEWSNSATWVGGVVPTAADDVVIAWGHTISPGSSTNISVVNLTNNGILSVAGNLTVTGTLTTAWATTIQVAGNFLSANSLTNDGTFQVGGNLVLSAGSLTNKDAKTLTVGGYLDVSGNVENSGTTNITGYCTVGGDLTNNDADQFTVGGILTVSGDVSNSGTLQVVGDCDFGGTFTNNDSDIFTAGGVLTVSGDVTNYGTLQVTGNCDFGGTLTNNDSDIFTTGGNLTVDNGISNSGNFSVAGISDITGNVTNNDSDFLFLGIDATIVGNVTNSGTFVSGGDLDITGTITNNNLDLIVVNGTFTKDGNLDSKGIIVIGQDYVSEGGTTTIDDWNGDFYVIGNNTCPNSDSDCAEILNVYNWLASTPGLPYLSSVTAEYNASGSFTVPAGITSLVVECWGGGGGGGGSTDNKSGGSGGGGGGYARGTLSVSPGQTINFTVGAGGAGSLGTGANGNPTNFPSTSPVFVANGGTGGLANKGAAGVGGTGVGGTTNTTGGSGSVGGDNGGAGGAGANGGAGGAGGISGVGGNGLSPGGGGGGGDRQNSNVAGGNGANGKVVITFSTLPILSFSFATSIQTEIENTINVEVSLATASTSNVSVPFEIIGGTATGGGIDYTLNSTSPLTIPAGSTTNSISITIKHDLLEEDDETIVLQLGTPTNASLGSPSIHTLTIADDDYPAPSLTVSSPNICLNSSVTFTASSNCQYIERFESSPNNADPWTTIAPNPFVGGACTATYTPPSNGTLYYRYFWYRNGGHKGISTPVAVTVNTVPVKPTSITGPTTVTQGQTGIGYLVSSIANATSYVWSYSGTGVTINGSGNSVTLDFSGNATSGDLTVYAVNGCGNGQVSDSFPITVNVGCNLSVSISSDFDDSCPELVVEQGFNAQSDSYDTGATKVTFTIVRTGSAVGWSFEYEIEDASVRTISPYPSPNPQQSFAPIAVLGSSIPIEFFISNNNVGIPTDVTLRVYNIEDTNNCIADEVSKGITIKAMPAIGDFN